MREIQKGRAAKPFTLPLLSGGVGEFKPADSRPKVIVFYKVTCPTCQLGMPYFDRLFRAFMGDPGSVVAVAQEAAEDAAAFTLEYNIGMPQFLDSEPYTVSRDYGLMNVPTVLSVGGDGLIKKVTPAFVKADVSEAAAWLAAHAGVPAPEMFAAGEDVPAMKPG